MRSASLADDAGRLLLGEPNGLTRAETLKALLEAFLAAAPVNQRLAFDPVELPHRYQDPRDIEVAGLISASLAYGRADLFKPKVAALLDSMGTTPAGFVANASSRELKRLLKGFVYRFNVAADLAVLFAGIGAALNEHGSLEMLYRTCAASADDPRAALSAF